MGLGFRAFVVLEHDRIVRLAMARFNRLIHGEPAERVADFAGQRIRYVLVWYDTDNRRPTRLRGMDCGVLLFDVEGRLDADDQDRGLREAVELMGAYHEDQQDRLAGSSSSIVPARHRFMCRAYDRKHKWNPSAEVLAELRGIIFGKPAV